MSSDSDVEQKSQEEIINEAIEEIKQKSIFINPQIEFVEVYHMVHIKNLRSIVENNLLSHNKAYQLKSDIKDISNQDVNKRREHLHDLVPFYFNPRNAMLYSCQERFSDNIIILGFKLKKLISWINENNYQYCISNGNASRKDTYFTDKIEFLLNKDFIDFSHVFRTSWRDSDYIKSKMMAEFLVLDFVSFDLVSHIYTQTPEIDEQVWEILNLNNKEIQRYYGRGYHFFNVKLVFF